jgi:hypothetical protein
LPNTLPLWSDSSQTQIPGTRAAGGTRVRPEAPCRSDTQSGGPRIDRAHSSIRGLAGTDARHGAKCRPHAAWYENTPRVMASPDLPDVLLRIARHQTPRRTSSSSYPLSIVMSPEDSTTGILRARTQPPAPCAETLGLRHPLCDAWESVRSRTTLPRQPQPVTTLGLSVHYALVEAFSTSVDELLIHVTDARPRPIVAFRVTDRLSSVALSHG